MTNLSPAAQAILDVANNVRIDVDWWPEGMSEIVAAALRAAADQVITDNRLAALNGETHSEARLLLVWARDQFLAIAAELEGANG